MKIIVPAVSDTCQRPFLTQATSYSIKTKPSLHLVLFHNQSSQASLVDLDKFHHHHPKLTPTHMHKHTHTNSESLHSADLPHLNLRSYYCLPNAVLVSFLNASPHSSLSLSVLQLLYFCTLQTFAMTIQSQGLVFHKKRRSETFNTPR